MFETNILILAAGYNKFSEKPCSLWSFGNGKSILDWQIHAFETVLPNSKINITIGYNYQRIMANYPNYIFQHVFDWEKSSSLYSFLGVVSDCSRYTLVMYGDTVFHPDILSEFNNIEDDVVVAVDSVWKRRFLGRSKEDIKLAETLDIQPYGEVEYTGLIKFSPRVMEWVLQQKDNYNSTSSFIDLLSDLQSAGFKISSYDVSGKWAEMNEPSDLAHFILGSKAETLLRIQPKLTKSKICDQTTCNWYDWRSHPEKVIKDVQSKFGGQRLIIRSSSFEEDGWETTQAGVFESILNVDSDNIKAVSKAIEDVFLSYRDPMSNTQVLIQPFITDVKISGVIFTCDMITGAPYYIINYDDVSGETDTITSGKASSLRTIILFHHEINNILSIDPRLKKVIDAVQELEQLLGYNKLDIEFAIDKNDQCFTFQIRPITVNHAQYMVDEKNFHLHLQKAQQEFNSLQEKPSHIFGNYTIFSRMTDWNPAEIIGTRPNALAINLYEHLITEKIWAKQRAEFGYRDIRPAPLVYNFCAQPYVDCRASINSFIPSDLKENCASRLVNAYLDLLKKNPHLHDKLELEIVFTIWVPTFSEDAKERFKDQNVSAEDIMELEKALKKLTANALVRLDEDTLSIDILSKNFEVLIKSDLKPVDKVYQLIEDCKKFGTLAFAHGARAGFVAVTLLKSLVKLGSLSQDRMLEFQGSIPTVASDFQTALSNNSSVNELVKKFGHLRPGTYDVNQLAYWEKPNFYFISNKQNNSKQEVNRNKFVFNQQELQGFQNVLDELQVEIEVHDFIKYLKKAIQARESTKFDFTRNLSVALDLMIKYGIEELGLTREDVGYLTFDDIIGIQTNQLNKKQIQAFVKLRKTDFSEKHLAKLPSFISSEKNFFGYEQERSEANFITRLNVVADLLFIKSNHRNFIKGKIVAITNADPGFDWIFSHNIAGLVTQYGGANSHMAIRCAELGIPAAIGIGDKLYEDLHEGRLMLDCQKGQLKYV
jgi:glutamine kinase